MVGVARGAYNIKRAVLSDLDDKEGSNKLRLKPKALTVHCTDTENGKNLPVDLIRKWHVQDNGWNDIGYHFIFQPYGSEKIEGTMQEGRTIGTLGAHVRGYNSINGGVNIGAALVGRDKFTLSQLTSLWTLWRMLQKLYGFNIEQVYSHNYFNQLKSCPNIPLMSLRDWLETLDKKSIESCLFHRNLRQ